MVEFLLGKLGLVLVVAGLLTMAVTIIYDEIVEISYEAFFKAYEGGLLAMMVGFAAFMVGNHWGEITTLVSLIAA